MFLRRAVVNTWRFSSGFLRPYCGRSTSLARIQEDLDSALERFALSGGHVRVQLEKELRRVYGLTEESPTRTARPQVMMHKELLDPMQLLHRWTEDTSAPLPAIEVAEGILMQSEAVLERLQGAVLELQVPKGVDGKVVVVGDTHGQLLDVLHILHTHGPPSESTSYLFNGDIADRGDNAVEIWLLALSFMIRWPGMVHILRGNHENALMNERSIQLGGGFKDECIRKYSVKVYEYFQRIFMLLPLFAVVDSEIFIVHAGLFRFDGVKLDRLRKMLYRSHYPPAGPNSPDWTYDETLLFDAQWSDPSDLPGIGSSKRGKRCITFGRDVTEDFLKDNGLSLCIRSHQVPYSLKGFDLCHGGSLLTVFSASDYGGSGNNGAVAVLRDIRQGISKSKDCLRLQKLSVECVEHYVSEESELSRSAKVVAQVNLEVMNESSRRIFDEASQHALGLLCLEREELWLRFWEADICSSGRISKAQFVAQLQETCGNLDWECLLTYSGADLGPEVSYGHVLNAVQVDWYYLDSSKARQLASAMLLAEIHVEGLVELLDPSSNGVVSSVDIHRAMKRLLPALSPTDVARLERLLFDQGGPFELGYVIERLLFFAPRLQLSEAWMPDALAQVGRTIQVWSTKNDPATGDCSHYGALLRFFRAFDKDKNGVLSDSELIEGLQSLERDTSSGGHSLDDVKLGHLAKVLDSNGSSTVAFLEMAQAIKPKLEPRIEVDQLAIESLCTCTSLIFLHRHALLHGCSLLDVSDSGKVSAIDFVAMVRAVGRIVGRNPTESQLQALLSVLGGEDLPYASALDGFHVHYFTQKCSASLHVEGVHKVCCIGHFCGVNSKASTSSSPLGNP